MPTVLGILAVAPLLSPGAQAQTVTIDPTTPIPASHSLAYETTWDVDGDAGGWEANDQFELVGDTPSGGLITGIVRGNDPTLGLNQPDIRGGFDAIIEIGIRKQADDDSRFDLFWGDLAGGFAPNRMISVPVPPLVADDSVHVVRIQFSGEVDGDFNSFRLDPAADEGSLGKSVSFDFFRVFSPTNDRKPPIEIDPTSPIPETHRLVFATEWEEDGNMEGWYSEPNGHFLLDEPTPNSGSVTGYVDGPDPQLKRTGLSIPTSEDTIIEFRINKETEDSSRIDLHWADGSGGIDGTRVRSVNTPPLTPDGNFHIVRMNFMGQFTGRISEFRFDIASDEIGKEKYVSVDFIRVYSALGEPELQWDPGMTGGPAGGSGEWNGTDLSWWKESQLAWPAADPIGELGVFGGTAGTVTVPAGGIAFEKVEFASDGYRVQGGPLNFQGDAEIRGSVGKYTLEAPLSGDGTITLSGPSVVFAANGQQTGTTRVHANRVILNADEPFGTSAVHIGDKGNVFLTALGAPRTIRNDIEWRGNRLIVNNETDGLAGGTFPLTFDGDLLLAGVPPSDIFLRQPLIVNGVVSGTGAEGRSLFFQGDSETMTLNAPENHFTGTITWTSSALLAVKTDAALGDPANELHFLGAEGGIQMNEGFDLTRDIEVVGDTGARIDTNGFDGTYSGNASGQLDTISKIIKTGEGTLAFAGTADLGGGIQVRDGTLSIPADGSITYRERWDNNHGVAGGATLQIDGGALTIHGSFIGIGNGMNADGEARFEMNSGSYVHHGGQLLNGFRGAGRFELNGGSMTMNQFAYGDGDPARTAVAELNGGTLALNRFERRDGEGTATITFNGTVVRALSNDGDFLNDGNAGSTSFLVGNGGAILDTASHLIEINSPLVAASGSTGGFTKQGAGAVYFSVDQSYAGKTIVSGGEIGANGVIPGPIEVAGGAGFVANLGQIGGAPGVGHSLLATPGAVTLAGPLRVRVFADEQVEIANAGQPMTFLTAAGGISGFNPGSVTVDLGNYEGPGSFTVRQEGNSLLLDYSSVAPLGYSAFAASITNADLRGFDQDADFDGIANGLEYALGGNPNVANLGILPTLEVRTDSLVIRFERSSASAGDTTAVIELSADLEDWTTIAPLPVTGSGPIEIAVPKNNRTPLFARLRVSNP